MSPDLSLLRLRVYFILSDIISFCFLIFNLSEVYIEEGSNRQLQFCLQFESDKYELFRILGALTQIWKLVLSESRKG